MSESASFPPNAIAIIGMAGRFPGAATADELWQLVRNGREAIGDLSDAELRAAGVPAALLNEPNYVRRAATLDGYDTFDAQFFGFSPRDAAIMDPQHRAFLETAWEALERAGYTPEGFAGSIGVFGGCGMQAYFAHNLLNNAELMRSAGYFLIRHTGNDKDFLSTRVSYQLNLRGPSVSVQTACSTSLVAVHLACQSLLNRESDMALAGGATIELPHGHGYLYEEGEILSPDGRCRAFDAASKGTVFGSGVGIVVLRRLEDAIEARDHVHAIILGSAVNNDGAGKVGYLAPSVDGQAAVVAEAIAVAGVEPESITYVETHGTGTPVGDPIEVAALTEAFGTARRQFCAIGSIKTNIGHLDTAAGVASLIKAASAVERAEIPPSLHFEQPNPTIDFASTPFFVNARLAPWQPDGPRRAGITSLGVGGTNAHVILEEPPILASVPGRRPAHLLLLSARTPAALDAATSRLADHLAGSPDLSLDDVAWTLQVGRRAFTHRRALVCADVEDAVATLRETGSKRLVDGVAPDGPASLVFLFPGGGAQYPDMGRGLYEHEPLFREIVDRGLDELRQKHGIDLRPLLFPSVETREAAARALERSTHSILSVFIVEYALARLWMSWGLEPDAMTGHSLGEYTAACLAGVFSFEDALTIVKARGDIFECLPAGAMLSVPLPEAEARALLNGGLGIAAINGPALSLISGPLAEIDVLEKTLAARDIETRRLHISVAAHSAMLEPHLDGFAAALRAIRFNAPTRPFISNLTGDWARPDEVTDPSYWVRHLRQTVRFSDGTTRLLETPHRVFVEVGPGHALGSLVRLHVTRESRAVVVSSMRHPQEDTSDVTVLLEAVGRAWMHGCHVDWAAFHEVPRRRVPLPTYPFERQRHWVEAPSARPVSTPGEPQTGLVRIGDPLQWLSQARWREAPRPEASGRTRHTWLVFAHECASGLVEGLRVSAGGDAVIVVREGNTFSGTGRSDYVIRPDVIDDYVRLLDALADTGASPTRVVHSWAVSSVGIEDAQARTAFRSAFASLLLLAQAIQQSALDSIERLDVVTVRMHRLDGDDHAFPEQALVLGPIRVIPRELQIACRSIDVDTVDESTLAEILSAATEQTVALRSGRRFVEQLEPYVCESEGTAAGLRSDGVYVITGGTGGIGRALAEYLARTYQSKIALVGRHEPPDLDRFSGILRAFGGQSIFEAADVTDQPSLTRALGRVQARLGPIAGVFHAAGTLDDGLIAEKTLESCEGVLAPKVAGTLTLHRALQGHDAAFLVLFSSTSARLGLPGQVDYTAANAFLDAFAHAHAGGNSAPRVFAIDWGVWRDVGMAARMAGTDRSASTSSGLQASSSGLLGSEVASSDTKRRRFEGTYDPRRMWVLNEHRLATGEAVLPGTGYVAVAYELARRVLGSRKVEIRDLELLAPLTFPGDAPRRIRVDAASVGRRRWFSIKSAPLGTAGLDVWVEHARGHIDRSPGWRQRLPVDALAHARSDAPSDDSQRRYMKFGPRWAQERAVTRRGDGLVARLTLASAFTRDLRDVAVHPASLDLAAAAGLDLVRERMADGLFVPVSYGRVRISGRLGRTNLAHVTAHIRGSGDQVSFDVVITDEGGRELVDIQDFIMRPVAPQSLLTADAGDDTGPITGPKSWVQFGIDANEGSPLLDRLLGSSFPSPVVVVSSLPLSALQADLTAVHHRVASPHRPTRASTVRFRSETEHELAGIWEELLGVEGVVPEDDFFELGGHSLIAVRLVNRIEKRFGTRLKLAQLFETRTLRDLASLLQGERGTSTFNSLVAVQPSGDLPTLYVVHGVGGEILSYADLARALGPNQPFYAFRSAGSDGSEPLLDTVEAQAALYISEMRLHQPRGPYYLAGYSHGGRVAYEMAQQLRASGQTVAFVGILDTWPCEGLPKTFRYPFDWLMNLPRWFWTDLRLEGRAGVAARIERARRALSRRFGQPEKSGVEAAMAAVPGVPPIAHLPQHIREMFEANFRAFVSYRPTRYDGPVVLFRATAQPLASPQGPDLGWGSFAASVKVVRTPGNHGTILQAPYVRILAALLREELRLAREVAQEHRAAFVTHAGVEV